MSVQDPWRLHGARRKDSDAMTPLGLRLRRFATDGEKVRREGHCRMCLRPAHVRSLATRHHLIPQSWFRQRAEELHDERVWALRNASGNIVPLCRPCHDLVETDVEARRMLRRALTQEEIAFVIDVRGLDWFSKRYPRT